MGFALLIISSLLPAESVLAASEPFCSTSQKENPSFFTLVTEVTDNLLADFLQKISHTFSIDKVLAAVFVYPGISCGTNATVDCGAQTVTIGDWPAAPGIVWKDDPYCEAFGCILRKYNIKIFEPDSGTKVYSGPVNKNNVSETISFDKFNPPLVPGENYYWRVRAFYGTDETTYTKSNLIAGWIEPWGEFNFECSADSEPPGFSVVLSSNPDCAGGTSCLAPLNDLDLTAQVTLSTGASEEDSAGEICARARWQEEDGETKSWRPEQCASLGEILSLAHNGEDGNGKDYFMDRLELRVGQGEIGVCAKVHWQKENNSAAGGWSSEKCTDSIGETISFKHSPAKDYFIDRIEMRLVKGGIEFCAQARWQEEEHELREWGSQECAGADEEFTLAHSPSADYFIDRLKIELREGREEAGETLNYTFYCHRPDDGVDITPDYDFKIDNLGLDGSNGTIVYMGEATGYEGGTTFTVYDVCDYPAPGVYSAKVIAEYGTGAVEDRVAVNVGLAGHPPVVSNLSTNAESIDYCSESPAHIIFSWQFEDSDSGDTQSAFQIQVVRLSDGAVYDSGKIISDASSITAFQINADSGGNFIWYDASSLGYDWRVRVWDSTNMVSAWSNWSSFQTTKHQWPSAAFDWSPDEPSQEELVQFTDQSIVYGGTSKSAWQWDFQNDGIIDSYQQNPTYAFSDKGAHSVVFKVIDSDNYVCALLQTINVQFKLPDWIEALPQ